MRTLFIFAALFAVPALAAPPATTTIAAPVKQSKATIDYKCGKTTYTLTTGNGSGICGSGASVAECTDSNGNSAKVYCSKGCSSSGSGSCTTKN